MQVLRYHDADTQMISEPQHGDRYRFRLVLKPPCGQHKSLIFQIRTVVGFDDGLRTCEVWPFSSNREAKPTTRGRYAQRCTSQHYDASVHYVSTLRLQVAQQVTEVSVV